MLAGNGSTYAKAGRGLQLKASILLQQLQLSNFQNVRIGRKNLFFSLLAFASNLVIFPALITGQLSRGKNRKQFGRNHSIPHLWNQITAPDWFKESNFSRAKYQNVSRKGHDGAPTKCSRFGPEMVL